MSEVNELPFLPKARERWTQNVLNSMIDTMGQYVEQETMVYLFPQLEKFVTELELDILKDWQANPEDLEDFISNQFMTRATCVECANWSRSMNCKLWNETTLPWGSCKGYKNGEYEEKIKADQASNKKTSRKKRTRRKPR